MILSLINDLGPWAWCILGLALLGLEVLAPGTFFLWFGISAIVVGAITLLVGPESTVWTWQPQLITFLALSLVTAVVGRRVMRKRNWDKSDAPDLNERGAQLVGETATLIDAIENGVGRVKIGDTTWKVRGSNTKAGQKVRVVGFDAGTLDVESVS